MNMEKSSRVSTFLQVIGKTPEISTEPYGLYELARDVVRATAHCASEDNHIPFVEDYQNNRELKDQKDIFAYTHQFDRDTGDPHEFLMIFKNQIMKLYSELSSLRLGKDQAFSVSAYPRYKEIDGQEIKIKRYYAISSILIQCHLVVINQEALRDHYEFIYRGSLFFPALKIEDIRKNFKPYVHGKSRQKYFGPGFLSWFEDNE